MMNNQSQNNKMEIYKINFQPEINKFVKFEKIKEFKCLKMMNIIDNKLKVLRN